MYVHIGGEMVVRSEEIIAIFDISVGPTSKVSQQFILHAEQNNHLYAISDEEPKSLVVVKNKVYYSPVSSSTLKRRTHQLQSNEVRI
jgi:hypothetical protein